MDTSVEDSSLKLIESKSCNENQSKSNICGVGNHLFVREEWEDIKHFLLNEFETNKTPKHMIKEDGEKYGHVYGFECSETHFMIAFREYLQICRIDDLHNFNSHTQVGMKILDLGWVDYDHSYTQYDHHSKRLYLR